jgi:putative tryptophan/tyrosine transport system substrate-binding protein
MKRREFIALVGGATLLAPRAAPAQEAGRTRRLGVLALQVRASPHYAAFFDELRQHGFVEGKNLLVDDRGTNRRSEQFPEIAIEMVKSGVDAILCASGDASIRAAQEATRTVPIVGIADDMVATGLVRSLAHPSSNTTGISIFAHELDGKRQELLMELVPGMRRMAALADARISSLPQRQALEDASRARGVDLSIHAVGTPEEIVPAIDAARASGAQALNVLATPLFSAQRQMIIEHTAARRLPAIYQWPEMAEEGGLFAYVPRLPELFRRLAQLIAKVLQGTSPADLPVEQPTKFELVINLKTAKALGLEIPPMVLARADEVIE